jgi:hypothetical protein
LDPYLDPIRPRRAGLQRVGVARCAASRRAAQAVNEAANGQPRVRPFGYERGRRNPSDIADRPLRVIQERARTARACSPHEDVRRARAATLFRRRRLDRCQQLPFIGIGKCDAA